MVDLGQKGELRFAFLFLVKKKERTKVHSLKCMNKVSAYLFAANNSETLAQLTTSKKALI
jgi:hypothetical protein